MRRSLFPFLLVGALCAGQDPPPAAAPANCEQLVQEFEAARAAHTKALGEASRRKDAEALKQLRAANPAATFVPRFQAGATAHAGKPEAVPFLVWIVGNAPVEAGAAALTTVLDEHLADPGIRLAVARCNTLANKLGIDKVHGWLEQVLAKNPDAGVQAQARFTRATMHVGTRAQVRSEALRQQAIADLKQVAGDDGNRSLQGLAKDLLFEAETLEPGLPAPEITGEDLDGVAFKLSDYRGKVVLLDFWGDW